MSLVRSPLARALVAGAAVLGCTNAMAAKRADACVKYEMEYGWSKGYAVEATVLEVSTPIEF